MRMRAFSFRSEFRAPFPIWADCGSVWEYLSVNNASVNFGNALDALVSVLFPAPCRICEAPLLTRSPIPICPGCLSSLAALAGPVCEKCGRPLVSAAVALGATPLCGLCRRGVYAFDFVRSFGAYNDAMSGAITLLKYEAVTRLGDWFGARLAEVFASNAEKMAADVVVPVPLHPSRQRERGYNQAVLIARPLARRLGLRLDAKALIRVRPRPDKHILSRRERWECVRGAYATPPTALVDNLRILLVDDVFTTGATLDACARALRSAGASSVCGLTVARVVSSGSRPGPVTSKP
jgi:ComF family protein